MSNKTLSLREQLPELNDSQWQLLERSLLAVLPEKQDSSQITEFTVDAFSSVGTYVNGFNSAIDQATDSIRKALSK